MHKEMYSYLKFISNKYPSPKAILMISAHWEEKQWTILDNDNPGVYFDQFYEGPDEKYNIKYPATSTQTLRKQVRDHLQSQNYRIKSLKNRGYDHGVFIPLMITYPTANIPVIQLSMLDSLDPVKHFQMGKALRGLRKKGFLIIGSGSSTHGAFRQKGVVEKSRLFDNQLTNICLQKYDQEIIKMWIKNWRELPNSEYLHPREQHLVPLFVNLGASQGNQVIHQKYLDNHMQLNVSNFIFT